MESAYPLTHIKKAFADVVQLLYPRLCSGCGNDLPQKEQLLCISCLHQLPLTNFYLHEGNRVEKIFWGRIPVVTASAYLYFTKHSVLQRLLHQFKYKGNKAIGEYFGRRMGETFIQCNRYKDIEALIPLPLYYKKERKRGYNQAEIICRGIKDITGLPVMNHVVKRIVHTETQTRQNREQRWKNIEEKFQLTDQVSLVDKHVLLIDDVITTGATLESCGMELLKIPGLRLSMASLAYTSL